MTVNTDDENLLFLHWGGLPHDQINDRLNWLRSNLTAGKDWGYCIEQNICLIMNIDAIILYKLTWFTAGNQTELTTDEISSVYKKPINNDYHITSHDLTW